jgi:hypothetical protein
VFAAELRQPQRVAHFVFHRVGKSDEVFLRRADPIQPLFAFGQRARYIVPYQFWDKTAIAFLSRGRQPDRQSSAIWRNLGL